MVDRLARLRQFIVAHYDLDEFRTLCFDLGINYDDLGGDRISAQIRELLLLLGRQRRFSELMAMLKQMRPLPFEQAGFSLEALAIEALYAELSVFEDDTSTTPDSPGPDKSINQYAQGSRIAQAGNGGVAVVGDNIIVYTPPPDQVEAAVERGFGKVLDRLAGMQASSQYAEDKYRKGYLTDTLTVLFESIPHDRQVLSAGETIKRLKWREEFLETLRDQYPGDRQICEHFLAQLLVHKVEVSLETATERQARSLVRADMAKLMVLRDTLGNDPEYRDRSSFLQISVAHVAGDYRGSMEVSDSLAYQLSTSYSIAHRLRQRPVAISYLFARGKMSHSETMKKFFRFEEDALEAVAGAFFRASERAEILEGLSLARSKLGLAGSYELLERAKREYDLSRRESATVMPVIMARIARSEIFVRLTEREPDLTVIIPVVYKAVHMFRKNDDRGFEKAVINRLCKHADERVQEFGRELKEQDKV